ncbi:MAG TPA: glycosyltransferase family 4 protein [bacterium]|nr:glycosyltransferase family 4 protein [bacterium]
MKKLRILYLSQYFPPEVGATQNRAFEMARNLAEMGHGVRVLCEAPNHPKGVIFPGYGGKLINKRRVEGVDVYHLWVYTSTEKNFKTRMLFYISYMVSAFLVGIFLTGYDVVFATSPPLFTAVAGRLIAIVRRKKFVMEVRDLWPEAAVQLGEIKSEKAIRLARRIEHWCYRGARKIILVTHGAHRTVAAYNGGEYAGRLAIVPNGTNIEGDLQPVPRNGHITPELDGKFVIIYAGLMGIAQGLETIVAGAEILRDDPRPVFFLVGEGPVKEELQKSVAEKGLKNVVFHPEVPNSKIKEMYSAADASIVPLRKIKLFEETVPSKLYDSLAGGLPVLLGVDGEARRILEESGGGVFFEPENPVALAESVRRMMDDEESFRKMGTAGRDYVLKNYSRRVLALKLAKELESV